MMICRATSNQPGSIFGPTCPGLVVQGSPHHAPRVLVGTVAQPVGASVRRRVGGEREAGGVRARSAPHRTPDAPSSRPRATRPLDSVTKYMISSSSIRWDRDAEHWHQPRRCGRHCIFPTSLTRCRVGRVPSWVAGCPLEVGMELVRCRCRRRSAGSSTTSRSCLAVARATPHRHRCSRPRSRASGCSSRRRGSARKGRSRCRWCSPHHRPSRRRCRRGARYRLPIGGVVVARKQQ